MKIEIVNDDCYHIYIYNDYEDLSEIIIKDKLLLIKKILHLCGFYRVIATLKKVGLFLEIIKVAEGFRRETFDLKVIIDNNRDVFFKTKDYFLVEDISKICYYDGEYYGLVDDSFDKILEKVEFGDFVFGCSLDSLLENCIVI